jgi:hypothetical protein
VRVLAKGINFGYSCGYKISFTFRWIFPFFASITAESRNSDKHGSKQNLLQTRHWVATCQTGLNFFCRARCHGQYAFRAAFRQQCLNASVNLVGAVVGVVAAAKVGIGCLGW